MLYISAIEAQSQIDCMGKRYYCPTENTYMLCFDDPQRNTTVTVTQRSTLCPAGTICDVNSEEFCESGKNNFFQIYRQIIANRNYFRYVNRLR